MKRALLFVLLAACHSKTNAVADAGTSIVASASASGSVAEEDEDELLTQLLDGGACPAPIHPDYCRYNCRGFTNRKLAKHARRIQRAARVALGKCDALDVFAEDEVAGDGGVQKGIVEYFDRDGRLVGAIDTRLPHCTQFGAIPKCTPQLVWEESHAFEIRMGPVTVSGGMPPEVVSRIVRQNFGRFKLCAQNAKAAPDGRYAAKMHIAKSGDVTSVEDEGSTVKSPELAECLATSLRALSFPEPEGGPMIAHVTILFSR